MTRAHPAHETTGEVDANGRPRVAIFQAEWQLLVHTVNPVRVLAESGFHVDVFLYRVREEVVRGALEEIPGVRVFRFGSTTDRRHVGESRSAARVLRWRRAVKSAICRTRPLRLVWEKSSAALQIFTRYTARFFVWCYPAWADRRTGMPPASVLNESLLAMNGHKYRALIGIEKVGLAWAGQVAKRIHVPFIYHNLELYTWRHYGPDISTRAKCRKLAEERYHRKSYATIVQDEVRGRMLFADNGVRPERVLYVPVSLLGPPYAARTSFFQERFRLPLDRVLVLQFGWLQRGRQCVELTHLAQRFPGNWTLVMHGIPSSGRYLEEIRAADVGGRVVLSLELVPSPQLPSVVSSAHVGLALYGAPNWNDRLTAFSSEKVALFLQCGIPIVAFNYPGYEILERERCGATIESLDELPSATERILACWEEFSVNARALFAKRYEFRANYRKVVQMLADLPDGETC